LGELPHETAEEILDEMEQESKAEVAELLEFEADSAGGLMNTEFVALSPDQTVHEALAAIRSHEDLLDSLTAVYLLDARGVLTGAVPLARLVAARPDVRLAALSTEPVQAVPADERQDRVTDRFDKYNLLALPVVDARGRMLGLITADDIISVLRAA
jgi:Mg/Co/Ni transporter MgtE